MPLFAKIKHRRDTEANWKTENPIIEDGELVVVKTDTNETRLKVGTGKNYNDSPFLDNNILDRVSAIESYIGTEEGGDKTFNNSIITSGVFSNVVYLEKNALIDLRKGSCFIMDNLKLGEVGFKFKITGVPEYKGACFTLIITGGGDATVYYPDNTMWANNEPPKLTSMGFDVLTFITMDGGDTWYGSPSIINAVNQKPTLDTNPT